MTNTLAAAFTTSSAMVPSWLVLRTRTLRDKPFEDPDVASKTNRGSPRPEGAASMREAETRSQNAATYRQNSQQRAPGRAVPRDIPNEQGNPPAGIEADQFGHTPI
jgi:hypothetical protein